MVKLPRVASILLYASSFLQLNEAVAAGQVGRATLNQVSQLILQSHKLLTEENNIGKARIACEKAAALDKSSGDPFISAMVHLCFGDVADQEENTDIACKHYASALTLFKTVPAGHPAHRSVGTHMSVTQGKRLTLAYSS